MSRTAYEELESLRRDNLDGDQIPNQPPQSPAESNFGDSSGPFFSIYSKVAEKDDNKMVERWQKDADGILIFTGLFSVVVAVLLSLTVPDLRPNSQDTSAFYLGNIYKVLADPNVTRTSIPSPVAKPPPFSARRYAVWVNSLWFLSLVMSLSCALLATLLHQWARRYIRRTQPARCSPEKRARARAFFSNGVDKFYIPWVIEGLPTLLHLSLFLFFGGVVILLFNLDKEVFICAVLWIGLFLMMYGLITLMPLICQDSPYYTPLSKPAWFLYACVHYVTLIVLVSIYALILLAIVLTAWIFRFQAWGRFFRAKRCYYQARRRCVEWFTHYEDWITTMFRGVEKIAEETALEQSSETDVRIFGWTITTIRSLGDDDLLEASLAAIPSFFDSKLVNDLERDFSETLLEMFWGMLDGFMGRTLSSNSVTKSAKSRRDIICKNIMSMMPCPYIDHYKNLRIYLDQAPVSIEKLQAMARWVTHNNDYFAAYARVRVAKKLSSMQERDNRWIALASDVYGLSEDVIRHNVALGGDNVLLSILIDFSRQAISFSLIDWQVTKSMEALTQFNVFNTLPGLQRDFCTLWNELVQEARKGRYAPVPILRRIRHLYVALHQRTDVAPAAFPPSTELSDSILRRPSSYSLCNIASHRPDSTAHVPVLLLTRPSNSPNASPHSTSQAGGISVPQQTEEASIIQALPPDPMTPSAIGDSSQAPAATSPALPAHTSPQPTDESPPGTVAAAQQDIPPAATLPRPLKGTMQHAEQDTGILSTTSMPAPSAGAASASSPLLPLSTVGFSIPTSPLLSRVPPLPDAESLTCLSITTASRPTGNTQTRLHARGLVNAGNMCFVNAVLQLLVHSPPFWNLFRELGDLKGQRGAGSLEVGGGATPLVDASIRFLEEFMFKEEPPPTQQSPQQAAGGKPSEDEEAKKEHKSGDSFEPTYMYDAMKEKRQLKHLLDGKHQDAEQFLCLYLDALDEELVGLHAFINTHKLPSDVEELKEVAQLAKDPTEVGKQDYAASSVESPISRIFDGKSRLTIRAPSQPDTVTIESWRSLKLHIQHDSVHAIQDALAHGSQPRLVQASQSGSSEAIQQVQIEVLPTILVLHLERFLFDAAADGKVKINKAIQLAPELEIPLDIMAPFTGTSAEPARYKLCGVLNHHGESAGSGHYTADVLHPNEDSGGREAWLHIDDESVSSLRNEDVFGGQGNDRMDDRCAYMLFYCRAASTQTL